MFLAILSLITKKGIENLRKQFTKMRRLRIFAKSIHTQASGVFILRHLVAVFELVVQTEPILSTKGTIFAKPWENV